MTETVAASAGDFDARRDSYDSWLVAINAIRERAVRRGQYEPRDEAERRQAAQGVVWTRMLDVVRHV